MDIEVEFSFEIMASEFAKVSFVPDDEVGFAYVMETCPTRKEGVNDGGYVFEVLLNELSLRDCLRSFRHSCIKGRQRWPDVR